MTTRLLSSLVISSLFFVISLSSGAQLASNISGVEGDLTPLQKHVSFFDRNKDGIVYPLETYQGFRAIGVGIALSSASALLINSALSSKTTPGNRIDPSFPVYVKNINLGKHGSDSGAYDNEGRFVPEKFEDIFLKYAKSKKNALTSNELDEMIKANRDPDDIQGWLAARAEWRVLYMLGSDKDGLLQKDTVRAVYDGTLFWELEKQHKKGSLGV